MVEIRLFLLLCLTLFSCKGNPSIHHSQSTSTFEWTEVEELNPAFDESLKNLIAKIDAEKYGYIDELFIAKSDSILVNKKFQNDYDEIGGEMKGKMGCGYKVCEDSTRIHDYNYYHSKFHPYYQSQKIHTLQSVTKSVLATMIGVAIQEGKMSGVDAIVYPYFQHLNLRFEMEEHLKRTTIRDLLTMQLGIEWNEFGMSLEMEQSSVSAMELSDDWVGYVLSKSIEASPGEKWNYNSGVSQMLSEIVQQSTGLTLSEYANKTLFRWLNISEVYWKSTPTGSTDGEGGLYLGVEDLAKIGLLYFQKGVWKEKRILPESWVDESFSKHAQDIYGDGGTEGYGYQWWLTSHNPALVVGLGYGNQIFILKPEEEIMSIIYAWNIFDQEGEYILTDLLKLLETI